MDGDCAHIVWLEGELGVNRRPTRRALYREHDKGIGAARSGESTFARVFSLTRPLPLMTRDTVASDTPASSETSYIVVIGRE